MVKAKYLYHKTLRQQTFNDGDSVSRHGLMQVKDDFLSFCSRKIGEDSLFWEYRWNGLTSFAQIYSNLYNVTLSKHITVAKVLNEGWSVLKFRRNLDGEKAIFLQHLKEDCMAVSLINEKDRMIWELDSKNGKSFYRVYICNKGNVQIGSFGNSTNL